LDEAARHLEAKQATRWEVDAELEALWTLVARVQGLVLDGVNGSSSLAPSLSMVVDLLEGRVDTAVANGVCWGPDRR
jgi:hypothetical protein